MPFFICPNCGHREVSGSRTEGFSRRPKGCSKCGFGFVFELLDDYYPAPNAAFFVCDQQERVIDAGKGSYELTGLTDEDVIGRPVREVLGLDWIDSGDGGPALNAQLNNPFDLAFAPDGSVVFSDTFNHCIRRIDAKSGVISTICGTGGRGFAGDGGPAGLLRAGALESRRTPRRWTQKPGRCRARRARR